MWITNYLGAASGNMVATMFTFTRISLQQVHNMILGLNIGTLVHIVLVGLIFGYLMRKFISILLQKVKEVTIILLDIIVRIVMWILKIVIVVAAIYTAPIPLKQVFNSMKVQLLIFAITIILMSNFVVAYAFMRRKQQKDKKGLGHSVEKLISMLESKLEARINAISAGLKRREAPSQGLNDYQRVRVDSPLMESSLNSDPSESIKSVLSEMQELVGNLERTTSTDGTQIERPTTPDETQLDRRPSSTGRRQSAALNRAERCSRCGRNHNAEDCWVLKKKVKCHNCGEVGHVSVVCKTGKNQMSITLDKTAQLEDIYRCMAKLQEKLGKFHDLKDKLLKQRESDGTNEGRNSNERENFHRPATLEP